MPAWMAYRPDADAARATAPERVAVWEPAVAPSALPRAGSDGDGDASLGDTPRFRSPTAEPRASPLTRPSRRQFGSRLLGVL